MQLNTEQQKAIRHADGPALIIAGPGSGKTAVITCRIRHLIEQCHVPAEDILAVTFSRKAAGNMKDRFFSMHSGKGLPFFGTFHSIFFMILRYAYNLTTANIVSEDQKQDLVLRAADQMDVEYDDRLSFAENILNEFSKVKSGSASVQNFVSAEVPPAEFRKLFQNYASALSEEGLIDFDDMLSMCLKLLTERPDILSYWQNRFRYILVDEFQDINPVQYRIIRLLAAPQNNLFVVGDDDQCIYSFRGSSPKILRHFLKDFPDAEQIVLNRSYRCPPPVLHCANKVIRENKSRLPKNMESEKAVRPGIVQIRKSKDQEAEYEAIAADIAKRIKDGFVPSDIAILTRTSLEYPFLIQVLRNHGIEVSAFPQPAGLKEHFIVKDIHAYLRLAENYALESGSLPQIREDLARIINKPSRYISKKVLAQAFSALEGGMHLSSAHGSPNEKQRGNDTGTKDEPALIKQVFFSLRKCLKKDRSKLEEVSSLEYHLRMLGKCTPYGKLQYICSAIGYEDYLKDYAKEFHGSFAYYQTVLDSLRAAYSPDVSGKQVSSERLKGPANSDKVLLMTIHAAKGLEFPHVYIPDVNEELFPGRKARTKEAIEEERRILYVAMTRAAASLKIYYAEEIRGKKTAPSHFLGCFLKKPL